MNAGSTALKSNMSASMFLIFFSFLFLYLFEAFHDPFLSSFVNGSYRHNLLLLLAHSLMPFEFFFCRLVIAIELLDFFLFSTPLLQIVVIAIVVP